MKKQQLRVLFDLFGEGFIYLMFIFAGAGYAVLLVGFFSSQLFAVMQVPQRFINATVLALIILLRVDIDRKQRNIGSLLFFATFLAIGWIFTEYVPCTR